MSSSSPITARKLKTSLYSQLTSKDQTSRILPIITPNGKKRQQIMIPGNSIETMFYKKKKRKIQKDMWICDVCRVAAFESLDEATAHEGSCKNVIIDVDVDMTKSKSQNIISSTLKNIEQDQDISTNRISVNEENQNTKTNNYTTDSSSSKKKDLFSPTKIAAIFQTKDNKDSNAVDIQEQKRIISEHRAAEFMVKRREQAALDRERQIKRQERNAQLKKCKDSGTNGEKPLAGIFQLRNKSVEGNTKNTLSNNRNENKMNHLGSRPTDQKGITLSNDSTKHSSASSYRFSSNLLPAPSFPSPSHVTGKYTDVLSKYDSPLNYSSTTKASIDREARDSISVPSTDPYPSLLLLKDSKTRQCSDVLNQQQILSSLFLPSLSSITSDLASSQSLWSDKYAMKSIPDDVYGEVNKKCAVELLTFINEWRVQRQQIMEARAAKARSRISSFMKGPKRYKDDDSDFMDSEDEEEGLCNVFLLTGSTGCGKTNLVHAAAMSCNCSVLEINTSKERGGQALKRAIEESTQSLSFLGKNNVGESDSSSKKKKDKMSNASITIVLIDEVDVLFENDGDAGFWLGLSNLVKKARSPIILTSTTIPLALRNSISFRFTHSHMKRPTPEECLPYIRNLISAESIQYRSADTEYDQERKLLTVARMYGCDLRKISNEIQLYSNTDSVANTEIRLDERAQHRSNRPVSSLKAITPSITQLNPGNVPSDRHSIIRITGKNFLIDDILSGKENTHRCNKDDNQNVLVTIGDKTCPRAHVIDSSTLLVLCPPCYIPTGVDEYGNRKDTLESSAECRFAPVQIQITSKSGFKFSSDFPLQIGHKPQLIYTFPDYDSDTCNNSNVDDLEESILKFNAEVENYESHNKHSTSDGSGISVDSNEILSKKQSVDDIDALLMSAELSSDAAFIQDSFGPLASMNLFGAVKGFGFDEVDDIIPSEKTKKPSLEKIYNNNWNDTSFFYGSTDCFMTRPIHKRDRRLLSNHLSSYQYSYSSHTLSNLNSKEPTEEESNSDYFSLLSGPLHLSKSEEGTLMPVQLSESVHSILEVLMEASKFDCVEYSGIRKDAITCQKDYERESNSEALLELMRKTLGEINVRISDMTKCLCGDIDDRILLDYAPYLRHMAHYECIYDKNYSENMKIMNEDEARLCHQARRSTRRGPKGRENYFDKFVNQNLLYCNGTKGNDLSLMLSQMRLQLEPDVH